MNETIANEFTYPSSVSTGIYASMYTTNMVSPVIKKIIKRDANELQVTKTNYTDNALITTGLILPSSVETSLIGETNMITKFTYEKYDNKGNVLQYIGSDGIRTSVLWGYNARYPVARLIGSDYSSAASLINSAILNAPSSDAVLRSHLNTLRSIPNSLVATYTYKPSVGMTSETDPRNRSTFYEYDQFRRLVLVKNHESKVLKKICYNYWDEPENCLMPCTNTTAEWLNTTSLIRCQTISGQNTGYQEQEQRDMNPCSATYNQLQWVNVGYNIAACPLPPSCTSGNCSGNDKKCVNGVCETGTWTVVATVQLSKNVWVCTYAYCFSDGSMSAYTQDVSGNSMCPIGCL